ncbi:MAG: alpha/beta hydrolase, partial [Desulfobacteraceae bacterium]|nr:alpha/beta hydrolase [Desulfobacteraceae bacterium]
RIIMLDDFLLNKNFRVKEKTLCLPDKVEIKIFDFEPNNPDPEKPIIVFVAGWITLINGWKDVLSTLAPKYRILYVETREKRSAKFPNMKTIDLSIEQMSRDIDILVDEMVPKSQPFYFAGSSMGATVILDYLAINKRLSVNSFLISPICDFPFPGWILFIIKFIPAILYTVIKPILKAYLSYFRLDMKNEPDQVKKYCGTIDAAEPVRLKANAYAIRNYSLWKKLSDIKSPVVIIGAKTDNLHGIDIMEKMVKIMPLSSLEMMESNKETHSAKVGEFIDLYISSH